MSIRRVYLEEETEDAWADVWDLDSKASVECWQQHDYDENPLPCCQGCAAFCIFGVDATDYVGCKALPRNPTSGDPAVIGELLPKPADIINE
jgi:hypothetical protein